VAEAISSQEWLCINGFDISGVSSNFGMERSVALQECVTFPAPTDTTTTYPYKRRHAGAETAQNTVAGYLDQAVNGDAFKAALLGSPIVTWGISRALGSLVTMQVGRESKFSIGGPVGNLIPADGTFSNDGAVADGQLYEFGTKTATGNGTTRTTIAVTTGKARYLHVHVVATTLSPNLVVIYETSAIGDYTDAVTRHTFTAFTPSYLVERAVKTAAVSDTHGRFRWTFSGTGSITVRMVEGVR
jgi:hypothetical protein